MVEVYLGDAMDLVYENMVASVATAIVLLVSLIFLCSFGGTSRPAGGSGGGASLHAGHLPVIRKSTPGDVATACVTKKARFVRLIAVRHRVSRSP